jgi:hypothetical protein
MRVILCACRSFGGNCTQPYRHQPKPAVDIESLVGGVNRAAEWTAVMGIPVMVPNVGSVS